VIQGGDLLALLLGAEAFGDRKLLDGRVAHHVQEPRHPPRLNLPHAQPLQCGTYKTVKARVKARLYGTDKTVKARSIWHI